MTSSEREPQITAAERDFYARMAATGRCPLQGPGPTGQPGVHYCTIGDRVRNGVSLRDAISDALAALQWTDPAGPFTRDEAARHLAARLCREHRDEVLEFASTAAPEKPSTPRPRRNKRPES